MAAKKTGGTGARMRAKNQAMAAMMKAQGIERQICRCPVCHNAVAIHRLYAHLTTCKT